jgi:hypothetical protein
VTTGSVCRLPAIPGRKKPKNSLQSLNPVALHNHPFGDLWLKLIDLELGHSRRVSPAGSTLFLAQYA